jgi:hypothetical protein
MARGSLLVVVAALLIAACSAGPGRAPGIERTEVAAPSAKGHPGLPLPTETGRLFAGSGMCETCHSGMSDEAGSDVSMESFWRSTMMANAARDPYWQASVAGEVTATPGLQRVIEDKCTSCHMPLARTSVTAEGGTGKLLGDGFLDTGNGLHALAMDGVSCTLCHQIEDTALGQRRSFSGGFSVDTTRPPTERLAFGPFPVEEDAGAAMKAVSGFAPVESAHMKRPELCATCHTLYTPYVDRTGRVAGEFPEQTAYLEYRRSDHRRTRTCQGCHMPAAAGAAPIAAGGVQRSPVGLHAFVGGNAYMVGVMKAFGEELAVTAAGERFDATIARTVTQLRDRTARLALATPRIAGSRLVVPVVVRSEAGHKLPTGFPSRRLWIRFTAHDAEGRMLFESGAVKSDGSIAGNDNDADPGRYEPHHTRIERADQVQIYETIPGDSDGGTTTTLLRCARYLKDNRILPTGFAKKGAPADIAVYGNARSDRDFDSGGDRIEYVVELGDAPGPFTLRADLLYQAIGYRWAENLRRYELPEVARFIRYYDAVPNEPVVVATATAQAAR